VPLIFAPPLFSITFALCSSSNRFLISPAPRRGESPRAGTFRSPFPFRLRSRQVKAQPLPFRPPPMARPPLQSLPWEASVVKHGADGAESLPTGAVTAALGLVGSWFGRFAVPRPAAASPGQSARTSSQVMSSCWRVSPTKASTAAVKRRRESAALPAGKVLIVLRSLASSNSSFFWFTASITPSV
jgi:hypothetical protein